MGTCSFFVLSFENIQNNCSTTILVTSKNKDYRRHHARPICQFFFFFSKSDVTIRDDDTNILRSIDQGFSTDKKIEPKKLTDRKLRARNVFFYKDFPPVKNSNLKNWPIRKLRAPNVFISKNFQPIENSNLKNWPVRKLRARNVFLARYLQFVFFSENIQNNCSTTILLVKIIKKDCRRHHPRPICQFIIFFEKWRHDPGGRRMFDQGSSTNKKIQPKELTNRKTAGTTRLFLQGFSTNQNSNLKDWPIRKLRARNVFFSKDFPPIKNSNLKNWPVRKLRARNVSLGTCSCLFFFSENIQHKKYCNNRRHHPRPICQFMFFIRKVTSRSRMKTHVDQGFSTNKNSNLKHRPIGKPRARNAFFL